MRTLLLVIAATIPLIAGCGRPASTIDGPLPGGAKLTPSTAAPDRAIADFPKLSLETDWPWWRGPTRNGIAATAAPAEWSATDNIVWSVPIPGRGHASPIVVGDRVFLATADEAAKVHSVVAFDRKTGQQLWNTPVSNGGFTTAIHSKNTHATPTVACDGERLFVTFFHHDGLELTALDLDGKQLWQKPAGKFAQDTNAFGYAPSPILYQNLVIVAGESDTAAQITAFDRATGETAWTTPRPKNNTYSTPAIAHVAGRDQMFLSGADRVASFDPKTGSELWAAAATTSATCGTVVWDGEMIFASGGFPKSETAGILADGTNKVVWTNPQKCYEESMLAHDGHVYALTGNGVFYCWRASDGNEMWKQRLEGPVSASPILAGGNIYQANERGTMYVVKANPQKYELVSKNILGDESMASPAVAQGQLFLRVASNSGTRQETLYCIGE